MTQQTTSTEISPRITEEMRDVLQGIGFAGAATAPAENIHAKIASHFGSIEDYLVQYDHR